jgi:cell division cycle 20-like protein 1 (cofactor of APC complex)
MFKSSQKKIQSNENLPFSISPLPNSMHSERFLGNNTTTRKIPKMPFKVLDAPQLQDDFYLNLVDWSS